MQHIQIYIQSIISQNSKQLTVFVLCLFSSLCMYYQYIASNIIVHILRFVCCILFVLRKGDTFHIVQRTLFLSGGSILNHGVNCLILIQLFQIFLNHRCSWVSSHLLLPWMPVAFQLFLQFCLLVAETEVLCVR